MMMHLLICRVCPPLTLYLFFTLAQTEVMTADEGQATTTLFLEATRNGRHPIGVLTSTLDKFINGGTTTEYMTQHVGTYVDDKYAKIESTTSREYYRVISPTKASLSIGESSSLTKPTGLVASSVSYDVHGSQTTEYTVRQFRTYIDGHYAHLVSSISKVYSDPPIISATPVYDPFGRHTPSSRLPKILPDKPKEPGTIPTVQVGKRKQEKRIKLDDLFQDSDSKHHLDNNDIRPRSIEDQVKASPVEDEEKLALPTFTVNSDGQLHIPSPSIEAIEQENEIEPTVAHRFEPVNRQTKTSLDSVTYIGFVDFTTTIDDTVVIFRPKKTFSTATRNIFIPKIEPTQTSDQRINLFKPSAAAGSPTPQLASSSEEKSPASGEKEQPRRSDGSKISPNSNRLSDLFNNNTNRLKSLLAASSSRRNKFSGKSTSSVDDEIASSSSIGSGQIQPSLPTNFGGRPRITLLQRPNQASAPEVESSSRPDAPEPGDISSSIDPNADVELVYKTLYTTYTYFTTFFRASSTRVKSREEVISNVVTLTNILGPSDLAKLKSSCEVDKTCQFISSTAVPSDFTDGFIGRPNTKASAINEEPRNSNNNVEHNGVFKTFFTTYTYFTTLFVDGSNSISTRTEVYSNVQSSGVPVAATQAPPRLQSSAAPDDSKIQVQASAADPLRGSRRLEYSSIARGVSPQLTTEQEKKKENEPVILDTESPIADALEEVDKIEPSQSLEFLEEIEEEAINAEENQIDASSVVVIPSSVKTFYTTYTYFTTLFRNGTSYVTSNLETVTNTADATASPTLVQPSVTFYTTFTYWTTSIDGDKTVITSREETKTDILPAATALIGDEILPTSIGIGIDATRSPTFIEPSTEEFELSEISLSEDTTTTVPELESSGEADSSSLTPSSSLVVTPSLSSSEKVAEVSSSSVASGFNELDDDFTLASSSINSSEEETKSVAVEDSEVSESSAAKSRLTFTRPSSTFTPVIRPNLFRTRVRPNNRIRSRSKSTTVAIITRSDVTPTLIATPVSSQLQTASPVAFSSSSRNLASASLLSRSKSSSVAVASSSINPARASSLSSSVNLVSSSVINSSEEKPEEEEEESTEEEDTENVPNILSNLRVSNIRRRPDSFAARLKERQRARLQQLRLANTTPAIRGGGVGGNRAPIFISTRTENFSRSRGNRINNVNNVVKTPSVSVEKEEDEKRVSSAESNIKLPPAIASQRDRARQRINALFRRRQPSFLRPRPPALNLDGSSSEADPLQVEASTRRRKRQVSSYGTRTRARQSYVRKYRSSSPDAQQSYSYQSPSSYTSFRNPYSSYSDSQYGTTSSNAASSPSTYENDDSNLSYSSTSNASNKPSSTRWSSGSSRRTVRQQDSSSLRTRGRSRFNPSRQRVGGRGSSSTTTTTTPRPSFSRFRPRTISSNRGTSNRFTSSGRRPSTSVFDYDDNYDYDYDYDVDLQSSQNSVPDAITVTHSVPVATQIPFRENGRNTFRDILTTSPSLEVVAVTALKSTNIDGSPVIYANVKTETPNLGTQVLTFEALRATETTAIEMTPTRIRGLRTSFSNVVPSTIYNIRPVTTSIVQQVDSNQLLSSLLLQLLGQKGLNPDLLGGQTSQVPQLNLPQQAQKQQNNNQAVLPQIAPPVVNPTAATQFITHTNSYVTTLTNVESTVLPITLRGRLIKTTLVESKTEVVTATELSTETKIRATPSVPAFGGFGGFGGLPTAGGSPLSTLLPADLQQQLLVAQLQQQLQQQQQQLFNQQLLSQVNLDQEGAINVEQTQIPDIEPSTSIVTIFVSGSTPGDFTRITSTVTLTEEASNERYKRDLLVNPSPVMPIAYTQAPILDPANGL